MTPYIVDCKGNPDKPYLLLKDIRYKTRYGNWVYVPAGRRSDGATGAFDIISEAWWVHDEMSAMGTFEDGMLCSNLQASTALYDILRSEGYWFRARTWFLATLAFGGGKARKNGIFRV